MTELNDHELLAQYARTESEAAFATLVARYVNLVYSAALRFSGNPHHAEEITQAVFIVLARKAGSLRRGVVLSGWLYQTARLTAANFVKSEIRRQRREQEAYMQSTLTEPESAAWEQIAPLLDESMGRLGETDRNAIVLRFFENKTAQEVGAALKLNEAAAHKRVSRALEKLRKYFVKRGVTLTATVIAGAVAANSVQASPVGLAVTVTAAAAKGAAVGGSTLTLVKGALKIMAWTKAKTAVLVGASVLLVIGTTIWPRHSEEGDNTYNAPGVEAFRKHLSSDAQIKLLRFSEIDGATGVQRHYLAAVDGDDFFLREYQTAEDPYALISTNNWLQRDGHFQGRYFGRFRNQCWYINGPYITKSSVSDPVVNGCQLAMKSARVTIDSVLNLGASAYSVKRGSFVWNATNSSRFTVGLATGVRGVSVSVNLVKLGDETELTNLWGRIIAQNGFVTKLKVMVGRPIDYEYATNSSVPFGIPTKITVGKRWFGYERMFVIEELVYGHTEDPQNVFSPESKYASPDIPRINFFTNGQRLFQ